MARTAAAGPLGGRMRYGGVVRVTVGAVISRVASALVLVLVLVLEGCSGDAPPPLASWDRAQESPPPRGAEPVHTAHPHGAIVLMGTGAMTPMVRELAKAFRATSLQGRDALVEDSVGSSGGVRAAFDGAIDIALVARPLTAHERSLGLVALPVARSAVVLAAHQNLHRDGLTGQEYTDLVAGRRTELDGQTIALLLRDRGESVNTAWERGDPSLTAAREAAYRANRGRVLYYDEAMVEALGTTPSSIGLTDFSLVASVRSLGSIKVLALEGRSPSVDAIVDGSWPRSRDLSFVYLPSRRDRVDAFVEFVRSEVGRQIIRAMHAAPLPLVPEGELPVPSTPPVGPEGLE